MLDFISEILEEANKELEKNLKKKVKDLIDKIMNPPQQVEEIIQPGKQVNPPEYEIVDEQ